MISCRCWALAPGLQIWAWALQEEREHPQGCCQDQWKTAVAPFIYLRFVCDLYWDFLHVLVLLSYQWQSEKHHLSLLTVLFQLKMLWNWWDDAGSSDQARLHQLWRLLHILVHNILSLTISYIRTESVFMLLKANSHSFWLIVTTFSIYIDVCSWDVMMKPGRRLREPQTLK